MGADIRFLVFQDDQGYYREEDGVRVDMSQEEAHDWIDTQFLVGLEIETGSSAYQCAQELLHDAKFYVMREACDQCLFTPERIVAARRFARIVKQCRENNTHFICHKATLAGDKNVCCRRFYDIVGDDVLVIRLAHMLDLVEEVTPDQFDTLPAREKIQEE